VGNGNIDVGNQAATRKAGRPVVERWPDTGFSDLRIDTPRTTTRPAITGAMAQQGGAVIGDNQCAPQKLVRLVGCSDPKARLEFKLRRMNPAKR
jgi:hypothetical protein